jgi:hypothetical protein
MSRPPEFFQPSSAGAWLAFGIFFVAMAVIWPWLLGLFAGVASFYVLFYAYYKMLGGK